MKRFHMLYVFAFKMLDEMFTNEKVGVTVTLGYSSQMLSESFLVRSPCHVDVPVPLGL